MSDESPLRGRTIGRYRIDALLGEGGMGSVYRAHDTHLDRAVAIKTIRGLASADPLLLSRFQAEIRTMTRISHPYVASVYDALEDDGHPLLVMELLDGQSLDAVLRARTRLPQREALVIALEIAEALVAIHAQGVVHRDLKPGNVMLTASGHVKVMDFGVARFAPRDPSSPTHDATTASLGAVAPGHLHVPGTLAYLAPEVVTGASPSTRSDLFALGAILWEMLFGAPPFLRGTDDETRRAILDDAKAVRPGLAAASVSGEVRALLERFLAKNPGERMHDATEAVARLGELTGTTARSGTIARRVDESRVSARLRWTAGIVAVIVALTALGIAGRYAWRALRAPESVAAVASEPAPFIAVLSFDGPEETAAASASGTTLAALMTERLQRESQVATLDDDRLADFAAMTAQTTPLATRAHHVMRATRVDTVVSGRLFRESERFIAIVDVLRRDAIDEPTSFRLAANTIEELAEPAVIKVLETRGVRAGLASVRGDESDRGHPDQRVALIEAGGWEARHEFRRAQGVLEQAISGPHEALEARILLARVLHRAGLERRAREAIADVEARLAKRRVTALDRAWQLEARAVAAEIRGQADDAIAARQDVAAQQPLRMRAHLDWAEALLNAGRFAEALEVAERAVAIDESDPRAHLARSHALSRLGRHDDAERARGDALRLAEKLASERQRALCHAAGGRIARAAGDGAAALASFEAAAAAFDRAGDRASAGIARTDAAEASLATGDHDAALALLTTAIPALEEAGAVRALVAALEHSARAHERAGQASLARAAESRSTAIANDAGLATAPKTGG